MITQKTIRLVFPYVYHHCELFSNSALGALASNTRRRDFNATGPASNRETLQFDAVAHRTKRPGQGAFIATRGSRQSDSKHMKSTVPFQEPAAQSFAEKDAVNHQASYSSANRGAVPTSNAAQQATQLSVDTPAGTLTSSPRGRTSANPQPLASSSAPPQPTTSLTQSSLGASNTVQHSAGLFGGVGAQLSRSASVFGDVGAKPAPQSTGLSTAFGAKTAPQPTSQFSAFGGISK